MDAETGGPIRVVHVLEATEGGTRRWLEHVVLGMDERRVQSACICAIRRDPTFERTITAFKERNVPVWVIDMCRAVRPGKDFAAMVQIARILRTYAFDVVHAHSAKAGMLARSAAWWTGVRPVIYTPHAFPFLGRGSFARVYRLLEKAAVPLTDGLMAVSESEAAQAKSLGYSPTRVAVVRNGVPLPGENEMPERARRDGPVVGTLMSFRRQKDPETLIRACALVKAQRPHCRFVLCGDGPLLGRTQRLARDLGLKDSAQFPGRVQDSPARLQSWDIFALSTHYEGLSYALLEAMAAGKPVVASRVSGVEEVLEDRESGILVEPENPEAFAAALVRLLDDPALARRLGGAARKRVLGHFTLRRQLDQMADFYERIVKVYPKHGPA